MKLVKKNLQIAIDGPVGSGKSIAAHYLAKKLKILYVNTGAMYRATAYIGLQHGLDLKKEEPLYQLLKKSLIELKKSSKKGRVCDVFVDNKDVTDKLYTPRTHWGSSQVAVFPKVRKYLVNLQKKISKDQAVVMEGRDITTVVLPQADFKIYMTAKQEIRAKRRLKDLKKAGQKVTLKNLMKEVAKRDKNDSSRKVDPLKLNKYSWMLDTTNLSIKEELKIVILKLKELGLVK